MATHAAADPRFVSPGMDHLRATGLAGASQLSAVSGWYCDQRSAAVAAAADLVSFALEHAPMLAFPGP